MKNTFWKKILFTLAAGTLVLNASENPEPEIRAKVLECTTTTKVLDAVNGRFSVEVSRYEYSGGNHGNTVVFCTSFDTDARKQIFLKDLFKEDFENELAALLVANDPRRKQEGFAYAENDDFSGIPCAPTPTENFLILPDGLEFVYSPYDIDCYAAGTIRVFVPYTALQKILK